MNIHKLVGQHLGTYQLESILGRGGMAVVYRARHENGQQVALKVLFPPPEAEHELLTRFQREAETVTRLKHPNIVSVLGVGQTDGYIFMAMPLIEGQTLATRLTEQGPLDETTAIDIAWQIADALYYAHTQGVIHRDIKPSNILLTPDGQAMLMDFGIALALDAPTLTRTGYTIGTPAYMSPEQASSQRALDGRSDLYSLGVVLYQMVTGRLPFQGHTPQMLHAHVYLPPPAPSGFAPVSPALEKVILKAMSKEASQRYQTGAIFAQALSQLDSGTRSHPALPTLPVAAGGWRKRLGWAGASLGVFLLLMWFGWGQLAPTPVALITPNPTPLPPSTATATPTATPTFVPSPTLTPIPPTPTVVLATPTPEVIVLPYPVGSLLQGSGEAIFWLGGQGELYHIYDLPTFLAFGFNTDAVQKADDALITRLFRQAELTRLIEAEDKHLDWVVAGNRWRINRWQTDLAKHGYQSMPPSRLDGALLDRLPLTLMVDDLPSGTLVKEGEGYYRLFADGTLRRFSSPDLVTNYGYNLQQATELPDAVRYLYPKGAILTALLQHEPAAEIFLIQNGQRVPMPQGEALWQLGYSVNDISQVPREFLTSFPLAVSYTLTSTVIVTDSDGLTRPVTSPICVITVDPALRELPELPQLGCPRGGAVNTAAAWEGFEHGLLLWRQDLNLIYVVDAQQPVYATGDRWILGTDIEFDPALVAPEGLYQPVRGFGKVWRERAEVKAALGWATNEEQGFNAIIQEFEQSIVWQDTASPFYVILFNQGGYARNK